MLRQTHAIQCIGCPVGCGGEVVTEDGVVVGMRGFTCDKGKSYAAEEVVAPRRMVTTTVRVTGGIHPLLPVASATPVPKAAIFECLHLLRDIEVAAPVEAGTVVLGNAGGLGVDFCATRDIPAG